ncbi:MAG: hypothetical protein OXH93_12570, partial [Caldilineaceae bacterium]|nr:hypothetical protein [Caldilineaceae bacterium]
LGLRPAYRGLDAGLLHIDTSQPSVQGLCSEPVQVLTPAVAWSWDAAETISQLAVIRPTPNGTAEDTPAVVSTRVGRGAAVLFAYDLPYTVARLRQGNPDHVDLCFAGLDGIYRPSELFVGQLPPEKMLIPQADLHTALLARLIEELAPRPRLWYYPQAGQTSALIMTSDDDWSTLPQFEALLDGLRRRQARCTFYVVPNTNLTRDHIEAWEAEGHTFSVHPALKADTVRTMKIEEPQSALVGPMLAENIERYQREFGRPVRTVRQHAVRWRGYVDAARDLADLGVRMDLNYIAVSPFLGYMCGSGRPLRFVDEAGALIDCFQQPTHWTEECLIHPEFVFSFKWPVERALEETGAIIRRAARRYYTPVALNSHPVSFATYSGPLIEGNWDTAVAEGMPILSADDWLDWTESRDQLRITLDAEGGTLHAASPLPAATLLLPPALGAPRTTGQTGAQERWGRRYTTITYTDLSAGASNRFDYSSGEATQ